MSQFSRYRFHRLCIHLRILEIYSKGFPHSEISGSSLLSSSPELIAGNHVLHRLSMPRHPPMALLFLNKSFGEKFSPLEQLPINRETLKKSDFLPTNICTPFFDDQSIFQALIFINEIVYLYVRYHILYFLTNTICD